MKLSQNNYSKTQVVLETPPIRTEGEPALELTATAEDADDVPPKAVFIPGVASAPAKDSPTPGTDERAVAARGLSANVTATLDGPVIPPGDADGPPVTTTGDAAAAALRLSPAKRTAVLFSTASYPLSFIAACVGR